MASATGVQKEVKSLIQWVYVKSMDESDLTTESPKANSLDLAKKAERATRHVERLNYSTRRCTKKTIVLYSSHLCQKSWDNITRNVG